MANEEDDSQKTEEPTPRKIAKARREGQVPISRDFRNWLLLLTVTVVLAFLGAELFRRMAGSMVGYLEHPHRLDFDSATVMRVVYGILADTALVLFIPFGFFVLVLLLGSWVQIGWIWAPKRITPNSRHISLVQGFKRLFSVRNLVEFSKSFAKLALVGVVGTLVLYPELSRFESLVDTDIVYLLPDLGRLAQVLLISLLAVYFLVVVADVVYQRYSTYRQLRMTRQELKDEHRQTEGSPEVRRRIQRLRAERMRENLLAAMRRADVVITNPLHYAVALSYTPQTMEAPVLVASGIDYLALRIRALAEEEGVPVVENPPLARALYASGTIDQPIDPEHYQAVAEVISYVWKIQNRSLEGL